MHLFASFIAGVLALLLLWRMWLGMWDYIDYPEYTQVLAIPIWTAYPPILVSLFLLLVAAIITLRRGLARHCASTGVRATIAVHCRTRQDSMLDSIADRRRRALSRCSR